MCQQVLPGFLREELSIIVFYNEMNDLIHYTLGRLSYQHLKAVYQVKPSFKGFYNMITNIVFRFVLQENSFDKNSVLVRIHCI